MADSNDEKKDEVPSVRFSEKKVDDSWKEEVRREREAAARAAAGKAEPRKASPAPSAKTSAAPSAKEGGKETPAAPETDADDPEGDDAVAAEAETKPKLSPAEAQQSKIFMNFLAGLAQQTLMQMGEMESPFTGQREVDLQGARYTIELIATIQNKTQGNLLAEEASALKDALHDLKMRYVEVTQEVQRQMQAAAAKGGPGGPVGPGGGLRPGPGGSIPGKRR